MKKIMILGASILQLPAIKKAKDMGLYVIAVDMNKNSVGFKYADSFEVISTIDKEKVIEAAIRHRIDGVMTLASDMPMRTVAAVAKELNLIGIDEVTAEQTTNKATMRKVLKENGVPVPEFYKVTSKIDFFKAVEHFNYGCVVKPTDCSGSRGVYHIKNIKDKETLDAAYDYSKSYCHNGEIIVEEFMEGKEVSVETLSLQGAVKVIAITDKLTTGYPYFVEMGHSQPTQFSEKVIKEIEEVAIAGIKALGINNGPSHTEIIVTDNGPKIVEIGSRLGGDCITTHLTPLSTGVDMVEGCIKIILGDVPNTHKAFNRASAIRYFKTGKGVISAITGTEEAEVISGIKQISFMKGIGDKVVDIKNSLERVGFVIAEGDTAENAIKTCEEAINKIYISLSEQEL